MSTVTLKKAIKRYGNVEVIHGVDLQIDSGDFCVFVGPSGCGKSTVLRMIAGLEDISEGTISIGDRDVTHLDPAERGIAMVFQTYALYPHMSVEENMSFGLRMNGVDKKIIRQEVQKVAEILKLGPYLKRKPKALSGGQRQRVAIGRALVRGPDVFLFDEPLSNLDAELRVDMRIEIARLHAELGATMIYVTHDQVEAMTLADKIVVLRAGRIEQIGEPVALYENPDNKFVAGFIGSPSMNFLTVTANHGAVDLQNISGQTIRLPENITGEVILGIRPEHIELSSKNQKLTIDIIERLGGVTYLHLLTGSGEKLIVETKGSVKNKRGDKVGIFIKTDHAYFFDKDSEKRIC